MATFPIQYTEKVPSGEGEAALYDMDVDTGARGLAAGIEKMGGAIFNLGMKISQQEQNVDYYEKKRLIDEAGWSAHNSVTGDEEGDSAIWEKFLEDSQSISQSSKWENVNSMLNKYVNDVVPQWQQSLYVRSLGIRKTNAVDRLRLEREKLLESGDVKGSMTLAENAFKLNAITRAERDNFVNNASVDSVFAQARKLIATNETGNINLAVEMLNQLKDLSGEQLEYRNSLVKKLEADKAQAAIINQRQAINTFTQKILDPQKNGWINQLELDKGNVVNENHKMDWQIIIDSQGDPPATETDWEDYLRLQSRVFDYLDKEPNSEIEDIQTELAMAYAVGKTITKKEYTDLLGQLDVNIPKDVLLNMRSLIEENLKIQTTVEKQKKPKKRKESYNKIQYAMIKRTAQVSKGLYDWVTRKVADGKPPTKKDMAEQKDSLDDSTEETKMPRITTKAEYDALPSGTKFIDALTGKGYEKP